MIAGPPSLPKVSWEINKNVLHSMLIFGVHIAPAVYTMKNIDGIIVLGEFLNKTQIQIFRVAKFMEIGHILY